jgi:hypothetical protein
VLCSVRFDEAAMNGFVGERQIQTYSEGSDGSFSIILHQLKLELN